MNVQESDLLELCLTKLASGEDLRKVLSAHPRAREEVEPLLYLALRTSQKMADDPDFDVINRSQMKMLRRAAELRAAGTKRGVFTQLPSFRIGMATALLLLIISGYGLFSVSAQALPGDFLYPIKLSAEQLQLEITADEAEVELLTEKFKERRTDEVGQLLSDGRVENISFEGVLDQIGDQQWFVNEIPVVVSNETRLIGDIQIGQGIKVEGETRPGGFVLAFELYTRLRRIQGIVDRIGLESWTIEGSLVTIIDDTEIKDDISVGDLVEALIYVADDQSFTLREVHLVEDYSVEHIPEPVNSDSEVEEPETEVIEYSGQVESIGSSVWSVGGQNLLIDAGSEIDVDIDVGDWVRVRAERRGGDLWALSIYHTRGVDDDDEEKDQKDPGNHEGGDDQPDNETDGDVDESDDNEGSEHDEEDQDEHEGEDEDREEEDD